MKAELYSKIPNYIMYGLFAVILIVFALFFCAGETQILPPASETSGEEGKPYPEFTSLAIYLCYAMVFISLILVFVFESIALVKNLRYSTKGLQKRIVRIVIAVAAVVGLYMLSPDQWDFVLFLQYALFGIAALAMLFSFVISKMRS